MEAGVSAFSAVFSTLYMGTASVTGLSAAPDTYYTSSVVFSLGFSTNCWYNGGLRVELRDALEGPTLATLHTAYTNDGSYSTATRANQEVELYRARPGAYGVFACCFDGAACTPATPATITIGSMQVTGVTGQDGNSRATPYNGGHAGAFAPGATLGVTWASEGASLPLTLQLRDADSARTIYFNVVASWELASAAGTRGVTLTSDFALGASYAFYLCNSVEVCVSAGASFTVGSFSVTGIDAGMPFGFLGPPTISFSWASSGITLPLTIRIGGVFQNGTHGDDFSDDVYAGYVGGGVVESGSSSFDLLSAGLPGPGAYEFQICDFNAAVCAMWLIEVGSFVAFSEPHTDGAGKLGIFTPWGHDINIVWRNMNDISSQSGYGFTATPPFTLSVLSSATGAVVMGPWTEAAFEGNLTVAPPPGFAKGAYQVSVCDSFAVCIPPHYAIFTYGVELLAIPLRQAGSAFAGGLYPFAYVSFNATLPLRIEYRDFAHPSILLSSARLSSNASNSELVQLPSWSGVAETYVCDAADICNFLLVEAIAQTPLFIGLLEILPSIGPVSAVAGFDAATPYAPGAPLTLAYTSIAAALPLTLSLRNTLPLPLSAPGNTTFVSWTLEGEAGNFEGTLPEDLPQGYYGARAVNSPPHPAPTHLSRADIFLCDANDVCGEGGAGGQPLTLSQGRVTILVGALSLALERLAMQRVNDTLPVRFNVSAGDVALPGGCLFVVEHGRPLSLAQLRALGGAPDFVDAGVWQLQTAAGRWSAYMEVPVGAYDMVLVDTLFLVATRLLFEIGTAYATDVSGSSSSGTPVAPGGAFHFTFNTTGATLPISVQLLSRLEGSNRLPRELSLRQDEPWMQAPPLVAWSYAEAHGVATHALPAAVVPGYYGLAVCDALGVCSFERAYLAVSLLAVTQLDTTTPIAPGAPLTFDFSFPGLHLPLFVAVIGVHEQGSRSFEGEATSSPGNETVDLTGLAAGPYWAVIGDNTHNFVFTLGGVILPDQQPPFPTILIGEFNLTDVDTGSPYPLGGALDFSWSTLGATLPLSITLRSKHVVVAAHNGTEVAGADSFALAGLAAGWYEVWLCDALRFCLPPLTVTYISVPALPSAAPLPYSMEPVLRWKVAFRRSSAASFSSEAVQTAVLLAASQVLGVPYNSLTFVGAVPFAAGGGGGRALGDAAAALVTLGVTTAAAAASPALIAAGGGAATGVSEADALTAVFGNNLATFAALLFAQPAAAPLGAFLSASELAATLLLASPATLQVLSPSPGPRVGAPPDVARVGIAVGVVVGALAVFAAAMVWLYCVPGVGAARAGKPVGARAPVALTIRTE